jgi:hypothetical protein
MEMETSESNDSDIEESSVILLDNQQRSGREKWFVLPPPSGNNLSQQQDNCNDLKPIHHYLYTLILFYAGFCAVSFRINYDNLLFMN